MQTFQIKPGFYVMLACALLLLPFKWVAAWFAAAAFHELCHWLALLACKVRVYSISIDISGAKIETEPMRLRHELLAALAGPCGGLFLLLFSRYFPRIAVCALFQSAFNLLPVFPLDGGRALRCCIIRIFSASTAACIYKTFETVILVVLLAFAMYAALYLKLGPLPIVGAVVLVIKSKPLKIPCKPWGEIVQ